jgi:hypothetical protein
MIKGGPAMPFGDEDNASPTPETGFGLWSTYSRTAGGIQVLYASFFGWLAFPCLSWTVQQMSWIAQNGFSFKGEMLKGEYRPAIDMGNFAEGTILALLSLFGFIGGCGLLGLRSWARRWEIAYFIFASVYSLWFIVVETRRGHDLGYLVLFYTILVLPYVPFLFISPPPCKAPLVGKVTRSKPVLDDLDAM